TSPGSLHHLLATGQAQPEQLLDAIKNYNQLIVESPQKFLLNPPIDLLATRVALSRLIEGELSNTAKSNPATLYPNRLDYLYKKAPEFTVIIEEHNLETAQKYNGSGTIIAREGNTYTILTTNHAVCRNQSEICNQFRPNLQVITHDKREYSIDLQTVKKIPGVDLAIFEITSEQDYQVAKVATYDKSLTRESAVSLGNSSLVRTYGQVVFASGWPGINPPQITELLYNLSPGILQPADKVNLVTIRPAEEGYEAVYTIITFPGMNGGPILDAEGRVIAIHGQQEGQRFYNATLQRRERVIIGYSLGIPIEKFLRWVSDVGTQVNLQIETTPPHPLSEDELERIGTHYLTDV
ncbi:MAG: S1 family peptidase, partial [Planktothrix sp.]